MSENGILKGIKVIELASVLAGPSVGSFLAEMGATVIKVENPETDGDTTRKWKSAGEDQDSPVSAYYASANWGKESIFLNLKLDEDRTILSQLLSDADIILENFKPGDNTKFKLDYKTIKSLYPKIIVGHIQGFPDSDRPAFDIVLQGETGFMSLNGSGPAGLKWPLPIVDILAAHQLKEGILLALLQRQKTNCGAFVSVSLFDAAVASLFNIAGNVLMGDADPKSTGRLHANIAPYGETITTSDRITLVLAAGTDHQFQELCSILGVPEDIKARFSTNQKRLTHRTDLENTLQNHAKNFVFADLEHALIGSKVPFGMVKTVKEVINSLPANSFLGQMIEGVNTVRMRTGIFKITS